MLESHHDPITVGPAVPDDPKDVGQVHQILFATDFGAASLRALPHAVALAREAKARLILLHILSPIPPLDSGPYWYSRKDLLDRRAIKRWKGSRSWFLQKPVCHLLLSVWFCSTS